LYSALHPRWTFAFAHRWSLSSRKSGRAEKKLFEKQQDNVKHLETFAQSYLQTHKDINYFIFGHIHVVLNRELTPDSRLIITGDWLQHFSYAVWDGQQIRLENEY
jgi:UDP-2,3-diacylglucosamine hydrolase